MEPTRPCAKMRTFVASSPRPRNTTNTSSSKCPCGGCGQWPGSNVDAWPLSFRRSSVKPSKNRVGDHPRPGCVLSGRSNAWALGAMALSETFSSHMDVGTAGGGETIRFSAPAAPRMLRVGGSGSFTNRNGQSSCDQSGCRIAKSARAYCSSSAVRGASDRFSEPCQVPPAKKAASPSLHPARRNSASGRY